MKSDKQLVKRALAYKHREKIKSLLAGLNPQQLKAVKATKGEVVVMAGAGSGKTRVLTRRVAYLIQHDHVNPDNILAVTFTNKASQEMQQRINKLLGGGNSNVHASTFHSLGIHILRNILAHYNEYPNYIPGYNRYFTIILPSAQRTLVKNIIGKELNKDTKLYKPASMINAISQAKGKMITAKEFAKKAAKTPNDKTEQQVYLLYEKALERNNEMDFDDLILRTVLLLKNHKDVRNYYQDKFRYISVDEFQDVSPDQCKMLDLLSRKYHNLFIVGDINQSIYSFRGSKPAYLFNFKKNHPKARQIFMTQNYRSTKNILKVANAVIKHNKQRTKVDAFTDNPAGKPVSVYRATSGMEEANFVAQEVRYMHRKYHLPYNKFAILYRTNIQSRLMERAMIKYDIKYQIIGGLKFYDRKEVLDILSYLKLLINDKESTALERIINVPKRHIGASSVAKLRRFADAHHYNLLPATLHINESKDLGSAPKKRIKAFGQLIYRMRANVHKMTVTDATKMILKDSGYIDDLQTEIANGKHVTVARNRLGNLKELVSATKEFDMDNKKIPRSTRILHFLSNIALTTAQDSVDDDNPALVMMTLHASKGMEFPIVFMVGMEDGLLPLKHQDVVDNMPEERRLCYVGITRAEKQLFLTLAYHRNVYGQGQSNSESPFLHEIPRKYLHNAVAPTMKKSENNNHDNDNSSFDYTKFLEKYNL